MPLSDSIAAFGVFRHARGLATSGSLAPRSHCRKAVLKAVLGPVALTPGFRRAPLAARHPASRCSVALASGRSYQTHL